MSERTLQDLWVELDGLRAQMKDMQVARELLVKHHKELEAMGKELQQSADKTLTMAQEISEHLQGGGRHG